MRSAACSPGRMRQSGTTQGLVHHLAYGGPGTIKTGWTASSLPACLSACHPGACWVTLTTGPSEGSRTPLQGKEEGSMGNEALPCKWNSFWITPSAHTHYILFVFTEGTTACRRNLSGVLSPGWRRFMGVAVEVSKQSESACKLVTCFNNKKKKWRKKNATLLQVVLLLWRNTDEIGSYCSSVVHEFSERILDFPFLIACSSEWNTSQGCKGFRSIQD